MGIDVVRFVVDQGKNHIPCQITFHPIPYIPFTVGYVPKGPLPDEKMVGELIQLGKRKNAIFIQLEPNAMRVNTHPSIEALKIKQLIPSHHPLFTKYSFVLDLTKPEDMLLASMHSKTRYNIRIAQKRGVAIKEDSSDNAFAQYLKLSSETTKRQGFYAHDRSYHEIMWNTLSKSGIAKLWTASYNGEILVSWIIFLWKDTLYYPYGASSRNHKDVMAPNLLLWEIARWGKSHGFHNFDLWGALGTNPDVHDPWYGFHRFKEGYRPELVEYVGSYDLVIKPLLYTMYCVGDTMRWTLLKTKT